MKIIELFKNDKKRLKGLFGLLIIFGLVSLPIGLWHSVRNLILFNQELGFVPPGSPYVHDDLVHNFLIPTQEELSSPFCNAVADCNYPIYILKSSLFGEWQSSSISHCLAYTMIYMNVFIICISLIATFWGMYVDKKKENKLLDIIIYTVWVVNVGSHIVFYLKLPYTCTMDFRYIAPTAFCGSYFIAKWLNHIIESKRFHWLVYVIGSVMSVFCLLSVLMMFQMML